MLYVVMVVDVVTVIGVGISVKWITQLRKEKN